jgi:hypothetical protein
MDSISVTSSIRKLACPLVEPIERIIVGAQILRQPELASNGAVEHPTKCDTIDLSSMDAEANDPARVLIHDDQDLCGTEQTGWTHQQHQQAGKDAVPRA